MQPLTGLHPQSGKSTALVIQSHTLGRSAITQAGCQHSGCRRLAQGALHPGRRRAAPTVHPQLPAPAGVMCPAARSYLAASSCCSRSRLPPLSPLGRTKASPVPASAPRSARQASAQLACWKHQLHCRLSSAGGPVVGGCRVGGCGRGGTGRKARETCSHPPVLIQLPAGRNASAPSPHQSASASPGARWPPPGGCAPP